MMMHVPYGEGAAHAEKLKRGLQALGPWFLARLCWWCHGTTMPARSTGDYGGHCNVCGKDHPYGTALGLLTGDSQPAPESVVNQVLVAAERFDAAMEERV